MKKISFKNNDYSRILLTEMLPYEVPLIFSNNGFFLTYNSFINGGLHKDLAPFIERYITCNHFKVPYEYKAKKASGDHLKLSVMHPASQIAFIGFYKDYDGLIVSLCQRSNFSLRYPSSPQAALVKGAEKANIEEIALRGAVIDLESDSFEPENMYPRSYFSYKKYDMLYKFYDSYEYQRLEKRFCYYMKFDISKCFHHIYTHTIGWAVKDKEFSKKNKVDTSFDGKFDRLMQSSNYNETNGIVVGPEVSRIFAEIILQKIDSTVESLVRPDLLSGRDYAVRRYVDDYFVFSNSLENLERIKKTYANTLEGFRLYINEKKTDVGKAPATTGITVAKIAVSSEISDFFSCLGEFKEEVYVPKVIRTGAKVSRNFIQRLKAITHEASIDFSSISGLALAILQKMLQTIASRNKEGVDRQAQERIAVIYNVVIEIMSFITAMDMRVRGTLVFAQTCLMVRDCVKKYDADIAALVKERITDEISILIQKQLGEEDFGIEKMNLLLAMRDINPEIFYTDAVCRRVMDIAVDPERSVRLSYFQIITLLYCFHSSEQFTEHRASIVDNFHKLLSSQEAPLERADYIMLLLDMLACPYLQRSDKERLLKAAIKGAFSDVAFLAKALGKLKWFTSWDEPNIERVLKRKALRPAYES